MIKILFICLSTLFITVNCDIAPYVLCDGRSVLSKDFSVDVQPCDTSITNVSCAFNRGDQTNFTIFFTPEVNITGPIERMIMAKFPKKVKNKVVEVPYGSGVRCEDRTFLDEPDQDGSYQTVEGKGLVAGKKYFFNNIFTVLQNSPKTTLSVRYLIREAKPCKRNKCHWKIHPGQLLVCVEIPVTIQ